MKKLLKKIISMMLCLSLSIGGISISGVSAKAVDRSKPWLLSTNRPAYASSVNGGDVATFATDTRLGTQWGAAANLADQWLDVDLGGKADISKVVINWQNNASYGVAYQILVSDDEINWTKVYETTNGTGGTEKKVLRDDGTVDYTYYQDTISTDAATEYKLIQENGRYVRVLINYSKSQSGSSDKKSGWGASIREIEIYGIGDENCIEPVSDASNIALGKNVEATSYSKPWWASSPLSGANAVDGNYDTYWLSEGDDDVQSKCNQSLTVDLGAKYTIGRVFLQWQVEYGNIWDLQVSEDGKNYKTIYRQLQGNGEDEDIKVYAENVRYVRMQGILMGRGSGYSIRELQVFEYQAGDEKVTNTIEDIPKKKVVTLGKGSYVIDDANLLQPREPKYVSSKISAPIPSNDWWTSIVYTQYSDTMPALPMAYKYSATGLSMYYANGLYNRADNGGMGVDSRHFDLTLNSSDITGTASAKLDGYGDWSVNVKFSDDDTDKMVSTLIKGSPYAYTTFANPNSVELNVNNLIKFLDKNGNEIITEDGKTVAVDHFAVETQNESEAPGDGNKKQFHYYGVYMPANSTVTKVGSKLKIKLGSNQNYLVIGALAVEEPIKLLASQAEVDKISNPESLRDGDAVKQLEYLYKYAYSYVTNTTVEYSYDNAKSICTTTYKTTVSQKRTGTGISNTTLMCMMPHQWKYSDDSYAKLNNEALIYTSARGDLRIHEGNSFSYSQQFNGIIPQYTTPSESDSYNTEWMYAYLEQFTDSALKSYWVADPYWEGKKSHPIAMGILIAEQLGEYETRDRLIDALKKIMQNWLTYDGDEDYPYYMYYHTSWGAVSGDGGDHGMAINLSDHHFLWAYFIFPAAVLASYDSTFVEDYGDMIELLIRDCMNPDKDDDMLPFMRNFDVYEGHSWAGGYGDNNSGNNQESASEATFGWAGLYLWGLVTGNKKYETAGIWGYTSEINAIEQYWFNIDKGTENDSHNWAADYGINAYGDNTVNSIPYIGMVWGLGYTNGTYFSGNPCCIMGIHMLPVTPAITYMGYDKDVADKIWTEYEEVQKAYQKKVAAEGNSDPEGWYHILWPYMSLSDSEGAAQRWAEEYTSHLNENGDYVGGVLSTDEMFNSYWYIQNMCAKGNICTDVWSSNYTSYQVFEKTVSGKTTYTAQIWNPSDDTITVNFVNSSGKLGSAKVPAHSLVSVDPTKNEDKTNDTVYVPYESRDIVNNVPGVIEAEDYDTNFGCEPTTGNEEGGYIGWIDDGDALVYNLEVEEEADYVVEYRVQCTDKNKNSAIKLKTDNDDDYILTTPLDNSVEGWKNVKSENTVHLKEGSYQMKLSLVDGGFNFNYIKIYKEGTKAPVAPTDDLTKADLSDYPEINLSNAQIIDLSSEVGGNTGDKMIDGDYNTRWESKSEDPQYFTIDLGKTETIGGIKIYWEAAASKNYTIETSSDNKNWTTVFTRTNGNGGQQNGDENRSSGLESISFTKVTDARYIRLYSTARVGGYGVSIFELKLYGRGAEQKEQLDAPTVSATLNGDKVTVQWNVVNNAEKYIVYRTSPTATKQNVATVTGTSYVDASLIVSGNYTYYVVAVPSIDSDLYTKSGYSKASQTIIYKKSEPETTTPQATEKPAETTKPIATTKPSETSKPTETTKPVETSKPDETSKNNEQTTSSNTNKNDEPSATGKKVRKGLKIKIGKLVYQLKDTKKKTVSVVSTVSKKVKKVTIPKSVKYNGVSYKVTSISNNAFKNRKKLTKVTIGKNITTIGKKAFYNCKKLKLVIIKSVKLKKVHKQAFRKIKKNAIIKVPKRKKKKYKKLIKSVKIR